MLKVVNSFLVLGLLVSAWYVYSLEHSIRKGEREIVKAERLIKKEREDIRLLDAEWSLLSRPERLQKLAEKHLKMAPVTPDQFFEVKQLAAKLPEKPLFNPASSNTDPIARMLKELDK